MKCTIENVTLIADRVAELHIDSRRVEDFAEFDDTSDLLYAFKTVIDWIKEDEEDCWNGIRFNEKRKT